MKLDTFEFGNHLKKLGFDFYSGVPCSFLKYLINYAINECDYIMAANEGDAVAIASGANLGGRKSVVLMQNSGLTNAVSPLTSLNYTFKLPVLGFVSLRGEPGLMDEPQHQLMGEITPALLSTMEVKWDYLSNNPADIPSQLSIANRHIENDEPYFFIVRKNTFEAVKLVEKPADDQEMMPQVQLKQAEDSYPKRIEALESLTTRTEANTILLATTGKTGRELYEVKDHGSHLYMVGSMGCISSLGLGLSLSQPSKHVVVIDGDGSLLMRMGAMPTIGFYQPENLLHVLLDNNSHDSTGGQATVSNRLDFVKMAAAAGYKRVIYASTLAAFEQAITEWEKSPALTFLYLKVAKGSKEELGRPSIKPHEVKLRLKQFING
ncbi:MAG: thiamine pyrophosphate enzyme [Cyclobacteriaceae bacterium]|nr:MAG: thiamine pyrophosphate enzyme [Cyclobacteriaceae bacterium]